MDNKRLSTQLLTAGLLSLSLGTVANAAEDLFSLPIEQLLQLKVASATLTNETMLTVPSSVAVYEAQDIQQIGLDSLDELLNFVTGIQSNASDRNSLFKRTSFRGRSAGTGGREILILLNGQRVNSEYSGNSDYTLPKIPLAIVEKVEIIKGTGSAIYGSNAFLGVINIITKSNNTPELHVAAGNMGSVELSASGGTTIGKVNIHASAAYGKTDGDHYSNVKDSYNPDLTLDISDPNRHAEVILNISSGETALNIAYSEQKSEDYYVQGHISKGFNQTDTESLFSTLNHNFIWNDKFNSDLWLDYRRTRSNHYIQGTPPFTFAEITTPPTTEPLLAKTPFNEDAHGIRLNNFYHLNEQVDLSVGFEYRHSELTENRSYTNLDYEKCLTNVPCLTYLESGGQIKPDEHPNIGYFGGEYKANAEFVAATNRDIWGTFIQSQIEITDDTELTVAVRYDDYNDIGQNTSPRVSLVSRVDQKNTVKVNYGEAYRAPQFNEIGLINTPLFEGNPNLKPETIKSLDVIWLSQHNYWNFSTTYFVHTIEDAIIDLVVDNIVRLTNNTQESQRTQGMELEVAYAPSNHFHLRFGATHFFDLAEDQFKASDTLAYLIANYHHNQWNYNLSLNYQSEKETVTYGGQFSDRVKLDGFVLVNSKISYQLSPKINLFAKAKNLLDKNFTTPAISNTTEMGVPNRGRQWFIGSEFYF
ncbi:TonB-dependent receptor plug domain-containing protein [Catenovulum adriaticum]|uniref:TonB-dependent receptor n=1 Tax=Catenovulum adriaticum TaxID=2984846 RepID=A0ABY7AMP5_9ALTE|nr:TonB-dependent receptor [Catenovulum sp. TS8]WAJ69730.1 TonB-dependent receptor [Catenovulum sp. TS8]